MEYFFSRSLLHSCQLAISLFLIDRLTLLTRRSYGALLIDFFARKTTSHVVKLDAVSLYTARMRLLARLRQTAFPSFLPATKAARPLWPCCFSFRITMSVISGVPIRLPSLKMKEISALDFITSKTDYTVRRLRPFARRRARTARPPFVFIRARKPWVFARLRVLG